MELFLTEFGESGKGAGLRGGRDLELGFRHVELEMPTRHLSRDAE